MAWNKLDMKLSEAVKNDSLDDVKRIVQKGADIDNDIIWWSVMNDRPHAFEILKFFADHPKFYVKVREYLKTNCEIARFAAMNQGPCAFDILSYLVKKRSPVNDCALMEAVENKGPCAFEMVKFLVNRGLRSIYARDKFDETLPSLAVNNTGPCGFDILKYLVECDRKNLNADPDERFQFDDFLLADIVKNEGARALDMLKYFIEQRRIETYETLPLKNVEGITLMFSVMNESPHSYEMTKLMLENGITPHTRSITEETALTMALGAGKRDIADYLLSRDDFLLSDLMPRPESLSSEIYVKFREDAFSHIIDILGRKGPLYAGKIAKDTGEILEKIENRQTKGDVKSLRELLKTIASIDWVSGAQVSSDDFLGCDMER